MAFFFLSFFFLCASGWGKGIRIGRKEDRGLREREKEVKALGDDRIDVDGVMRRQMDGLMKVAVRWLMRRVRSQLEF